MGIKTAVTPCPSCLTNLRTAGHRMGTFKIQGVTRQFEMVASPIHNPDSPESRILIFKRDVTLEQEYQSKYYQAEKMATIGMTPAPPGTTPPPWTPCGICSPDTT